VTDWQPLATLFAALCPSFSLVGLMLGAAVALYFFRAMGMRWPREQEREQEQERPQPSRLVDQWEIYERPRVAAEDSATYALEEYRINRAILVHTSKDGPGIVNLHFAKRRE